MLAVDGVDVADGDVLWLCRVMLVVLTFWRSFGRKRRA